MLVGWAILSPLAKLSGWAPGPVGDMGNGARGWILWISLGIMCADSLVSLLPIIFEHTRDLVYRGRHNDELGTKEDDETETPDRLVPLSWVIPGLLASIIVGTILVWVVFGTEHIKSWATMLGFVLGGLLSIIALASPLEHRNYPLMLLTGSALSEKRTSTQFLAWAKFRSFFLRGFSQEISLRT